MRIHSCYVASQLTRAASLRSLRDTAGRVGLEGMRDKLDVLCDQVMQAKMLSLTFGAEIWMSSVFTHAEVCCTFTSSHSLTMTQLSSAVETLQTASDITNERRDRLALALTNRALSIASLQHASEQLYDALLAANALGTSILSSTEWNELLVSIDERRRRLQPAWTGPNDPVWKSDRNLLAMTSAVARCSLLSDAVFRTRTLLQFTLDILSHLTPADSTTANASFASNDAQVRKHGHDFPRLYAEGGGVDSDPGISFGIARRASHRDQPNAAYGVTINVSQSFIQCTFPVMRYATHHHELVSSSSPSVASLFDSSDAPTASFSESPSTCWLKLLALSRATLSEVSRPVSGAHMRAMSRRKKLEASLAGTSRN